MKADVASREGIIKLSAIINIIFMAYILTFLFKLEQTGCECASDWRRVYIIIYCVYKIAFSLLQYLSFTTVMLMLGPINFALDLLFIVFTFQYVHRLKREKCSCSEDLGRTILYIVAAIDAAMFVIIGLGILANIIAYVLKSK